MNIVGTILITLIFVMVPPHVSTVTDDEEIINSIRFPFGGPFMGIFVALSLPLGLKTEDVFLAYNLEANYNLPENQTTFLFPPIIGERAFTRRTVYNLIQSKLSKLGYPGYECLLRVICDMSVHPMEFSNGVLGDLLHILLTPSTSRNFDLPDEYEIAEVQGLEHKTCEKYNKLCSYSIIDIFSSPYEI